MVDRTSKEVRTVGDGKVSLSRVSRYVVKVCFQGFSNVDFTCALLEDLFYGGHCRFGSLSISRWSQNCLKLSDLKRELL